MYNNPMSDRERLQEHQFSPEKGATPQIPPPSFAERLRETAWSEENRIIAKGVLLGVGGGLAAGAASVGIMSALDIGTEEGRFLGGLVIGLVTISWVHLRGMRHDYARLFQPQAQGN